MKPLLIWVAVFAVIFGVLALLTSALRDTTRVFVVVDTSFAMSDVWGDVRPELDAIDDKDHAEFALATEKDFIHSWQSELELPRSVDPFAPCTFEGIESHAEVAEADDLVLITTSGSCDTSQLTDWEVVILEP